jgi:hypothetical protein
MGYPKYKILSYKPTQKWHVSLQSLEKDFYLSAIGSFDHDFTQFNYLDVYVNKLICFYTILLMPFRAWNA